MFDFSTLEFVSKAAVGFSDVISKVISGRTMSRGNGGGAILAIPPPDSGDGPDKLLDLRLPPDQLQAFQPVFDALQLRWEDAVVQVDTFEKKPRHLHRFGIQFHSDLHFCMHLPKWLFDDNNNRPKVDFIHHSFKSDDRVYLLSKEVHYLNYAFDDLFVQWRKRGIDLHFVPWGKVEDIRQLVAKAGSLTDNQRKAFLNNVFGLAGPVPSGQITLSSHDRSKLTSILQGAARVHAIDAKAYYTQLLKGSSLPQNWKDERIGAIKNDPTTDAPDLISWAVAKGRNPNPGRHEFSAVAELILASLPALGLDDADFLRKLVSDVPLAYSAQALAAF